jgi:uncharacterized protein YciI
MIRGAALKAGGREPIMHGLPDRPQWAHCETRSQGKASDIIAWMKYAAIAVYTPDASTIARARPAHREYLNGLIQQGRLVISGPFSDDSGGLLVYEAETPAEVEKMVTEDPFARQGVFVSWEIRPWNVVFVNRALLCPEIQRPSS